MLKSFKLIKNSSRFFKTSGKMIDLNVLLTRYLFVNSPVVQPMKIQIPNGFRYLVLRLAFIVCFFDLSQQSVSVNDVLSDPPCGISQDCYISNFVES